MDSHRYTLIQRSLHWLIAALVVVAMAGGIVIHQFGFAGLRDTFGPSATNTIYMLHKSFGVTVLALMLLRLAVRLRFGAPEYADPIPSFSRLASRAVHFLFYAALIAMPVFGWLGTAARGFPVEFFGIELPGLIDKDKALGKRFFYLHHLTARLILFLAVAHILGAIYHWKIRRDGVMGRMSLP